MPGAERHLNARVVSMPEAVHRTWGFQMRAGTSVTHLITRPPYLRMRAISRRGRPVDADDDGSSTDTDSEPDDDGLKFMDGVL